MGIVLFSFCLYFSGFLIDIVFRLLQPLHLSEHICAGENLWAWNSKKNLAWSKFFGKIILKWSKMPGFPYFFPSIFHFLPIFHHAQHPPLQCDFFVACRVQILTKPYKVLSSPNVLNIRKWLYKTPNGIKAQNPIRRKSIKVQFKM